MKKIEIRPKSKYYTRSYGYSIPKRNLLIEKSQKAIKEQLEEAGITDSGYIKQVEEYFLKHKQSCYCVLVNYKRYVDDVITSKVYDWVADYDNMFSRTIKDYEKSWDPARMYITKVGEPQEDNSLVINLVYAVAYELENNEKKKQLKEKITNTYVNNPPQGLLVQDVKLSCKSLTKSRVDLKVKIKVSL